MSANFLNWMLPDDVLSDASAASAWTSSAVAAGYSVASIKTALPGDSFRFKGTFRVLAGGSDDNDVVEWTDSGGTGRTATLTPNDYSAANLASHIQTQMNASPSSDVYAVTYSTTTGKFTIAETGGPSNFTLEWASAAAPEMQRIALLLGYINSSDDTGAASYTGDNVIVHSEEYLQIDMGSAVTPDAGWFMGTALSTSASIKIYGHTSNVLSTTPNSQRYRDNLVTNATEIATLTSGTNYLTDDENDFASWTSSGSFRHFFISIIDTKPRSGFVHEFGRVGMGTRTTTTRDYTHGWRVPIQDLGGRSSSTGGLLFGPRLRTPIAWTGSFRAIATADRDLLRALWREGRTPLAFWWEYQDAAAGGLYGQVTSGTLPTRQARISNWNIGPLTVRQLPKRIV